VVREGEAEAVIDDASLGVGPVSVSFLDADALHAGEYRVELELWPSGRLVLTQMGRRHDAFLRELRRARNRSRVVGLLAHGVTMPETFEGSLPDPAEIQLYDTHLTVVPEGADPFQVPFGSISRIRVKDDPPAVVLDSVDGPVCLGLLGRQRDVCSRAIGERLDAHARVLSSFTGQDGFADGLAVPRSRVRDFGGLVDRSTAPSRVPCAGALIAAASGDPRFGFVQLLDPDGETLAAPSPLPERWAAFLLVPLGALTALEIVAGPAAATYLFRGSIDSVNHDLQQMHFRRAPLALTEEQATLTPTNPHRLALRRLEPLRRLRACTAARIVHNEGWDDALRRSLV
jgi:hypothetical protein